MQKNSQKVPAKVKVHECFVSPQGEMPGLGLATGFVRVYGCNRTCTFCDTGYVPETEVRQAILRPNTYPVMTAREVVELLVTKGHFCAVELTGGEPLLFKDFMAELRHETAETLAAVGTHLPPGFGFFRVQTNGELLTNSDLGWAEKVGGVHFVVSPKLPGSGQVSPNIAWVLEAAAEKPSLVSVKLVIRDEADYDYARQLVLAAKPGCGPYPVYLQPAFGELSWRALWDMFMAEPFPYPTFVGGQFHKTVAMP